MHIICPSGLAGEIRGLRGKEGKLLSDRASAKAGSTFEKILSACWLETIEPGPYDIQPGASLDWGKVLIADRFYTLLQIRTLTYGHEYSFAVQCASRSCRDRFDWEIDLEKLVVQPLSPDALAAYRDGNRFETRLHDGRKIWFKLLTGTDEMKAASVLRSSRDGMLITALAMRVVEIEGVPPKDKRAFLEDMEMADAAALLDRFDEVDGGVETTIEIECPSCLGVQDIDLPFERGFFLPRKERSSTIR